MSDPRKAEANSSTATFKFRDVEFTVPLEFDEYPLSFIEAMEDGKSLAIQARELLGPKQWAEVRGMKLKAGESRELFDAIDAAMGTTEGEDEASSG